MGPFWKDMYKPCFRCLLLGLHCFYYGGCGLGTQNGDGGGRRQLCKRFIWKEKKGSKEPPEEGRKSRCR